MACAQRSSAAHREADQGVQVFSGVQSGAEAQICTEAKARSPILHLQPLLEQILGDKAAAPVEGRFRGGGVPTRCHETPGRALLRSPLGPLRSLPGSVNGIQGATRAGGRAHSVEDAQAHFSDPAGGGPPGSRAICLRRETSSSSSSWCARQRGAGPASDKTGTTGSSSSSTAKAAQPASPCLKTSSCCLASHFHRFVQTRPGSLPGLPRHRLCAGNAQSRQTRASPPPPLSCRRCGMNSKCRHGRKKKCANSNL